MGGLRQGMGEVRAGLSVRFAGPLEAACGRAIHAPQVQEALAKAMTYPQGGAGKGTAGEALTELQSQDQVDAHIGLATLLALRSQGRELLGAMYCQDPPRPGSPFPDKWFGVATDGLTFIVNLAQQGKDGKRELSIRAVEPGTGRVVAGPFSGVEPEELFSCGRWQPHPNGAAGKLFDALWGKQIRSWIPTPRCDRHSPDYPSPRAPAPGDFAGYDPKLGERIAESSLRHVIGGTGWCYRYVLFSLEGAGLLSFPESYTDPAVAVPLNPAYRFARWADAYPERLGRHLRMRRRATPKDPGDIPRGSVVVFEPTVCGHHARAGHIEIAVSKDRFCSDHCRVPPADCFRSAERAGIRVYIPVKAE